MTVKLIAVTGPRDPPSRAERLVQDWVNNLTKQTVVYHGDARGVDAMARDFAKDRGLKTVPVRPNYNKFAGSIAPLVRNAEMVSQVDEVVGFWHGQPFGGTLNTLWVAHKLGKQPSWILIDDVDEFHAEATFRRTCAYPQDHWLEAFRIWERSKSAV